MKQWLLLGITAMSACHVTSDEVTPAQQPRVVRVAGSSTMYRAVTRAAGRFAELHSDIEVRVERSSSREGLDTLIAGTVDVAPMSRPPAPGELARAQLVGVVLKPYQVGYDAIAVIVSPDRHARVPRLSLRRVREIFVDGSVRDWSQLAPGLAAAEAGPITVYVRDPERSGTGLSLVTMLTGDWNASFVEHARVVDGHADVIAAVAADPGGIGFVPLSFMDERVSAVALSRDGRRYVLPGPDTVRNLSYPLRRKLYLVTRGTPRGDPNLFLRFVLGPEGQASLAASGVIPMR